MFIFPFNNLKEQMHFYIVKKFSTMIKYYLNDIHINGSEKLSILLHSFAADMFNSTNWYTSPIGKMVDILNDKNIVVIRQENYEHNGIKLFDVIKNNLINEKYKDCIHATKLGSFGAKETYIIQSNSMNFIWIKNKIVKQVYTDDKMCDFIVSDQEGGNNYYKYMKYKQKYLMIK